MAKPGWYPDPHAVNTQRFWDGEKWTEQVMPLAPDQTRSTAAAVTRGILLAVFVLALLGYVLYQVVASINAAG